MDEKDFFRKNSINKTKKLIKQKNIYKIQKKSIKNLENLLNKLLIKKMNILFYLSIKSEISTDSLIKKNIKRHNIFVPFIQKEGFKMVPYRLPLEVKSLNIRNSKESKFYRKKIDVLIVPIIGLDKIRRRIGFGKGMYDRFFSSLKSKPIVIFTQLDKCFSEEIITRDYDITGDFLVTYKGVTKI